MNGKEDQASEDDFIEDKSLFAKLEVKSDKNKEIESDAVSVFDSTRR